MAKNTFKKYEYVTLHDSHNPDYPFNVGLIIDVCQEKCKIRRINGDEQWVDHNDLDQVQIVKKIDGESPKIIDIPGCCTMVLRINEMGGGNLDSDLGVTSIKGDNLKSDAEIQNNPDEAAEYNAAIDGIESLVLALACKGIDVETPAFADALQTAIEVVANHF